MNKIDLANRVGGKIFINSTMNGLSHNNYVIFPPLTLTSDNASLCLEIKSFVIMIRDGNSSNANARFAFIPLQMYWRIEQNGVIKYPIKENYVASAYPTFDGCLEPIMTIYPPTYASYSVGYDYKFEDLNLPKKFIFNSSISSATLNTLIGVSMWFQNVRGNSGTFAGDLSNNNTTTNFPSASTPSTFSGLDISANFTGANYISKACVEIYIDYDLYLI